MIILTHSLELLFELNLMLAVRDAEVIVRVRALIHTIRRGGGADGHHGGRALRALGIADFADGHHFQRKEGGGAA